jgi:carboxymethylenebutenolidase
MAAVRRPDAIGAVAPFYGLIPWEGAQPDWSTLEAPVRGHYAENDEYFGPAAVAVLKSALDEAGKDAVLTIHPGVDHAFFNDARPEVYNAAEADAAWATTVEFFASTLV